MDTETFRKVLLDTLGPEKIGALADSLGLVERQSKVRMVELVMALILTARTGGRQADCFKHYRELTGQHGLYRGTLYARFTEGLARLMETLLDGAMDAAEADGVLLPPALRGVKDWLIRDSTTVKLNRKLLDSYPGTGDYAALKVHKTFSLGLVNLVQYQLSPARDHDAVYCPITEELRGHGLIVDLGYASHDFILGCRRHDVKFVMKLKSGWKVRVEDFAEGVLEKAVFDAGPFDFADAFSAGDFRCVDGALDADVSLLIDGERVPLRLVAVEVPGKQTCVFLTNLPRDRYPAQLVGDIYRLRWEIEKDNKLDKTDWRLDELDARKPDSVHTMIYASLLGSVLVNRLVHLDHRAIALAAQPMRRGPLHARLVALCLAACHGSLIKHLADPALDPDAVRRAAIVVDCDGRDPNWRNSPSVLDRLHGFVGPRGRPRRQKAIGSRKESTHADRSPATI